MNKKADLLFFNILPVIGVAVFFANYFYGYSVWLKTGSVAGLSYTTVIMPILALPFLFFSIKWASKRFFICALVLFVFLFSLLVMKHFVSIKGEDYIYGVPVRDASHYFYAMYGRWLTFFLLGASFAIIMSRDPRFARVLILTLWLCFALAQLYMFSKGFSMREHIEDLGAERINYRHSMADWSAILSLFLCCLHPRKALQILLVSIVVVVLSGGGAVIVAFSVTVILYLYLRSRNQVKPLVVLVSAVLGLLLLFSIESIIENVGKTSSFEERLYLNAYHWATYFDSAVFGNHGIHFALGTGGYAHNIFSYLFNYGLLLFALQMLFYIYIFRSVSMKTIEFMIVFHFLFLMFTSKGFTWSVDWLCWGFLLVRGALGQKAEIKRSEAAT